MTEPVGSAPLDRLPDAGQPEGLAGVDGEVGVLAAEVLERIEVPGGWETGLGAGDVETDDAVVAIAHDESGDLGPHGCLAHRRQQRRHPDPSTRLRGFALAVPEAGVHRFNHVPRDSPLTRWSSGA